MERLDRLGHVELADVDALVGGAGGEGVVGLPVDVEGGRGVEGELLLRVSGLAIPNNCRAIDA